mgnify:FL=1
MNRILIVDDEQTARKGLFFIVKNQKDDIFEAENKEQAKKLMKVYDFDLAIVDLRLPKEAQGLELIKYIRTAYSLTPVLVMTAYGSVESAVRAMKAGAQDFITKDFTREEILMKIKSMLEMRKLWFENIRLTNQVKNLKAKVNQKNQESVIIGESPEIKKILNIVSRVGEDNDTTVLITGESGTGKELIARSIHFNSPDRKNSKYVIVDISNMPSTLLESQLFGHQKGSFTSAHERHIGLFEQANGGTVFLDEIGDFPLELQIKLLRFIQEKAFMRVGGDKIIYSDVRIIAATNKDVEAMVRNHQFREDLFYRLNVVRLHLPALRERKNDIPLLLSHFQQQIETKKNKQLFFPENIIAKMRSFDWPGNVRQLKNVIESLYVTCADPEVHEDDLLFETTLTSTEDRNIFSSLYNVPLKEAKANLTENFEKKFLKLHYYLHNGNISIIASKVGESRESISRKIKKYGIKE